MAGSGPPLAIYASAKTSLNEYNDRSHTLITTCAREIPPPNVNPRTSLVSFQIPLLDVSKSGQNAIRPEYFVEDVAAWMIAALKKHNVRVEEKAGRSESAHCFDFMVARDWRRFEIAYHPGTEHEFGSWLGRI